VYICVGACQSVLACVILFICCITCPYSIARVIICIKFSVNASMCVCVCVCVCVRLCASYVVCLHLDWCDFRHVCVCVCFSVYARV
jgi:hypothetical protein